MYINILLLVPRQEFEEKSERTCATAIVHATTETYSVDSPGTLSGKLRRGERGCSGNHISAENE